MKEGPRGLESVADYPNLLVELLHRGYSDADVQKIAGRNFLRVWRAAEQVLHVCAPSVAPQRRSSRQHHRQPRRAEVRGGHPYEASRHPSPRTIQRCHKSERSG